MTNREKALAFFRHHEAQIPMPGARAMYQEAIKALEQPAIEPERWIPCSERLPEALQEVIVTSTAGYVYTSRIVHGDFEYGGNVIAWMPLPDPYKERNEE